MMTTWLQSDVRGCALGVARIGERVQRVDLGVWTTELMMVTLPDHCTITNDDTSYHRVRFHRATAPLG